MEVGAVKQAFNNEVIFLKKKLNQARIHVIHKLTRKAKQLTEKKAPDALKEKLKRKAESAIREVLIIKKIKAKELAKFMVTHKGELKDFLNKPTVDNDKACARLLLHKALEEKYLFFRGRFSNVPIQDLFMSRIERRQEKKEQKEKQKNKNKNKGKNNKVINSEGDWNVEDINVDDKNKINDVSDKNDDKNKINKKDEHNKLSDDDDDDDDDIQQESQSEADSVSQNNESEHSEDDGDNNSGNEVKQSENGDDNDSESDDKDTNEYHELSDLEVNNAEPKINKLFNIQKPRPVEKAKEDKLPPKTAKKPTEKLKKNKEKKQKELNKNKNLNEKLQQRKFKKDSETAAVGNKIVDPFFITSTGDNYMSVVEPRGPDEIKDEHKQGNRKLRRAVMFGHAPRNRPRYQNNNQRDDNRFNRRDNFDKRDNFNNRDNYSSKFNNSQDSRNNKSFNNDFNDRKRFNDRNTNEKVEEKVEKLHPSWEAKKKKSGILPFEGKKIVFD